MEALSLDLGRGFRTLLDACDFEREFTYNFRNGQSIRLRPCDVKWWPYKNRNYIYATGRAAGRAVVLHRLITEAPAHLLVDHRGDTLDNRRSQLRVCNHAENGRNSRKHKNGRTSKFKGVRNRRGKWYAQWHWIENGRGRCRSLGIFATEELAARAYDAAALQHFGEFARLNFPDSGITRPTPSGRLAVVWRATA